MIDGSSSTRKYSLLRILQSITYLRTEQNLEMLSHLKRSSFKCSKNSATRRSLARVRGLGPWTIGCRRPCYAKLYATFMWKICKLGSANIQHFPATFNTLTQVCKYFCLNNQANFTNYIPTQRLGLITIRVQNDPVLILQHWTDNAIYRD